MIQLVALPRAIGLSWWGGPSPYEAPYYNPYYYNPYVVQEPYTIDPSYNYYPSYPYGGDVYSGDHYYDSVTNNYLY